MTPTPGVGNIAGCDGGQAGFKARKKTVKTPVLWAATQNNLGSLLFLMGKRTKNADHLRGVAEAFDLASGVYRARGMDKIAAITEKNLGRVNRLLDQSQPKGVPRMRWEGDGPRVGG